MTDAVTTTFSSRPPDPPSISASELHELLMKAHICGNTARLRFIEILRTVKEQRAYLELGFPDVVSYATGTFRYRKSQVYEFLRVADALEGLPLIRENFERGRLSWNLAARMTRVATAQSEAEWIELAGKHGAGQVLAEIEDAARKKRSRPRKDVHGLPGLSRKLSFELTPQDHAIVEQAFARVGAEMAASLEGERPAPGDILIHILKRVLAEGLAEKQSGLPYLITYRQCRDCRRTTVETAAGPVEVSAEVVERIAGDVPSVEIAPEEEVGGGGEGRPSGTPGRVSPDRRDRPNSPALRRKLIARSGGRCENPSCRRHIGDCGHGHHIRHRACGGPTAMWNEVYVCATCHALIHAGLLIVEGDPAGGALWRTRSRAITARVDRELAAARGLPRVIVAGEPRSGTEGSGFSASSENRERPPLDGCPLDGGEREDALTCLGVLGGSAEEAWGVLEMAWREIRKEREGQGGAGCRLDGRELVGELAVRGLRILGRRRVRE